MKKAIFMIILFIPLFSFSVSWVRYCDGLFLVGSHRENAFTKDPKVEVFEIGKSRSILDAFVDGERRCRIEAFRDNFYILCESNGEKLWELDFPGVIPIKTKIFPLKDGILFLSALEFEGEKPFLYLCKVDAQGIILSEEEIDEYENFSWVNFDGEKLRFLAYRNPSEKDSVEGVFQIYEFDGSLKRKEKFSSSIVPECRMKDAFYSIRGVINHRLEIYRVDERGRVKKKEIRIELNSPLTGGYENVGCSDDSIFTVAEGRNRYLHVLEIAPNGRIKDDVNLTEMLVKKFKNVDLSGIPKVRMKDGILYLLPEGVKVLVVDGKRYAIFELCVQHTKAFGGYSYEIFVMNF